MAKARPDAVVSRNDPLAAQLIRVLSKLRIAVPKSVMIAEFDDATTNRKMPLA